MNQTRPSDISRITRKQFLFSLGAVASLSRAVAEERTQLASGKILIVVAHPDDESAFAATVYRYAKELGGIVDHVVITNGEAGYRYSQLAAAYYNANLTNEDIGRSQLPAIRKRETVAAGKILGVRHHYFLDQKDTRYTLDVSEPLAAWNTQAIHSFLCSLLKREQYSFVFTLLPSEGTHGHHKAATLLAAQAVDSLPVGSDQLYWEQIRQNHAARFTARLLCRATPRLRSNRDLPYFALSAPPASDSITH